MFCSDCKKSISYNVYNYSKVFLGRALCMKDQKAVKKSTPEAKKLGEKLRKFGWKVDLEKWDGHKHVDISILKVKVNIEVDGKQHNLNSKQALADLQRTYYSFLKDWLTLRIPNSLVRNSKTIDETASFINNFLKKSKDQLDYLN